MENTNNRRPRFDLMISTGEQVVLKTTGEKEIEGQRSGGKYLITIDEFGRPVIEKEIRNYG